MQRKCGSPFENNATSTVHFGWCDDGFVLGDSLITADGERSIVLAPRVVDPLRTLKVGGSLEGWAKITQLLKGERYAPHRFALIAGLSSILLKPLKIDGSVLSLVGKSGSGKSAIGFFTLSAFGKWQPFSNAPTTTELHFIDKWYVLHNLPNLVDEANLIPKEKTLNSLVMAAANADVRGRQTQKGLARAQPANRWKEITIFTANERLMDLGPTILQDAAKMRITEVFFDDITNMMTREDAQAIHDSLLLNYGHAGRALIKYAVQHRNELEALSKTVYEAYAMDQLPPDYRYRSWIITAAAVLGFIGEELNIIRYDTKEACAWALANVKSDVSLALTPTKKVEQTVATYIVNHQASFSHYNTDTKLWGRVANTFTEVRGKCFGRYSTDRDDILTLAIPTTEFLTFAHERGIDKREVEKWVKAQDDVWGKDVKLVQLSPGPSNCFVITIKGEE